MLTAQQRMRKNENPSHPSVGASLITFATSYDSAKIPNPPHSKLSIRSNRQSSWLSLHHIAKSPLFHFSFKPPTHRLYKSHPPSPPPHIIFFSPHAITYSQNTKPRSRDLHLVSHWRCGISPPPPLGIMHICKLRKIQSVTKWIWMHTAQLGYTMICMRSPARSPAPKGLVYTLLGNIYCICSYVCNFWGEYW